MLKGIMPLYVFLKCITKADAMGANITAVCSVFSNPVYYACERISDKTDSYLLAFQIACFTVTAAQIGWKVLKCAEKRRRYTYVDNDPEEQEMLERPAIPKKTRWFFNLKAIDEFVQSTGIMSYGAILGTAATLARTYINEDTCRDISEGLKDYCINCYNNLVNGTGV